MIVLAMYGMSFLLFIVILLWILVPAFYGLPPVPTKPERIYKALKLANLNQDEVLYDLGAGVRERSPASLPRRSGREGYDAGRGIVW